MSLLRTQESVAALRALADELAAASSSLLNGGGSDGAVQARTALTRIATHLHSSTSDLLNVLSFQTFQLERVALQLQAGNNVRPPSSPLHSTVAVA